MAVYLCPSGDKLRDEIHDRFGDDLLIGWVGDRAHAARVSDHNPERWAAERRWDGGVHALDVPNFPQLDALCGHLRREADAGREPRLTCIIRNRRIASLKSGWEWRGYDGESHTAHAHFSLSYVGRYEKDRRAWLAEFATRPRPKPGKGEAPSKSGGGPDHDPVEVAWRGKASDEHRPGSRSLTRHDAGSDVELLQDFIGVRPGDGWFGAGTERSLKDYQRMRGLTADGICGRQTWAPILNDLGLTR